MENYAVYGGKINKQVKRSLWPLFRHFHGPLTVSILVYHESSLSYNFLWNLMANLPKTFKFFTFQHCLICHCSREAISRLVTCPVETLQLILKLLEKVISWEKNSSSLEYNLQICRSLLLVDSLFRFWRATLYVEDHRASVEEPIIAQTRKFRPIRNYSSLLSYFCLTITRFRTRGSP